VVAVVACTCTGIGSSGVTATEHVFGPVEMA
jgi:hypothetical protein